MPALPWTRSPASIRARLVLLVLALWIPAAIGLALQTRDAYRHQEQAAREGLRQLTLALNFSVESELDRRQVLAQALAASPLLRARDIPGFERQARMAVQGTGLNAMLVDRTHQHLFTGRPERESAPRGPEAFFVESGSGVVFVPQGPVTRRPSVALFVPESGTTSPRYNVGVTFPPAEINALLARQRYPDGGVASVIDNQQRVMGRSRDPERWIGVQASHRQLRDMAKGGGSGFVVTTTLDGVSSLTFVSPPNRHGWAAVVAMPQANLQGAAGRLAAQAVAGSALLLVIGLVVALWVARRISRPVHQLEHAGEELLAGRVPEPLRTGLSEIDRVAAVLHDAGVRSRESERLLESRVNQAVAEARDAEARLFEARKHEAIGRLTGGVAHDFNNLLQTMSMGMELVQRAVPEGRHSKALNAALAACGKAAGLVRQMLAFGRSQPLRAQAVDLADLLLQSRELTGKALGERIRLVAQLEPALPAVLADPTQLELALLNLVFNARDALPDGGTVTVRARPAAGEEAGLEQAACVRVDVQDDGQGMDEETLARVFEPYFTTKPVGKGTGLGLPQVQAVVRQSGGDVRIASTPGQGTCVTLFLPIAEGPADVVRAAPVAPRTVRRSLRVMMVEDDVLVASVVPAALEREGHRVTLCRTADDARALLAQGMAAEILFTDVVMPGSMTGLDLVQWCAENRPELPALVATGYSAQTPKGIWKLLRKPYSIEDLLTALDLAAVQQQEPA